MSASGTSDLMLDGPRLGPARLHVRLWAGYRYPLMVFALSRVVVFALFAMEGWVTRTPRNTGVTFAHLFHHLGAWDGIWYRSIALHGYDPGIMHGDSAAFFPLYPAVLALAHAALPFVDLTWQGVLLSTAFGTVGMCLFYRLTLDRLGLPVARRAVLYLAISPLSFVFSAVYAESLFLVAAVGAFLLVERGRWRLACATGALAVLARPVGIMLAPALAWRAWRDCGGGRRPTPALLRRLAWVLLLPLAELCFQGYLWWRTGDPLAMTNAQVRGWGRGVALPPLLIFQTAWEEVWQRHQLRFVVHLSFVALWLLLLVTLWRRRRQVPLEYTIFAAGVVALPFFGGTLLAAGRYGMMGFPLFWALAILGRREDVDTAVKIIFPTLMGALIFVTYGIGTFTP